MSFVEKECTITAHAETCCRVVQCDENTNSEVDADLIELTQILPFKFLFPAKYDLKTLHKTFQ